MWVFNVHCSLKNKITLNENLGRISDVFTFFTYPDILYNIKNRFQGITSMTQYVTFS